MPFYFWPCLPLDRARHVKCDEEKPACRKCRSTGRICDGHGTNNGRNKAVIPSLLYGKLFRQSNDAIANNFYHFLQTQEERHCYDYFLSRTHGYISFAFNGAVNASQLMLQFSQTSPTVKLIVLAVGSIGEHLDSVRSLSEDASLDRVRLEHAQNYYVRAIAQLQKDMSVPTRPRTETILISCFLLTLFDFLRGEENHARVHLHAGIDILRRCYASVINQGSDNPNAHQDCDRLPLELARVFTVMDMHAAMWLGLSTHYSAPIAPHIYMDYPTSFGEMSPTMLDLSTSLNYQVGRVHMFHHDYTSQKSCQPSSIIPFHVFAEKSRLLFELQHWPSELSRCLSTMPSLTAHESRRVALMKMNYHSILIFLSSLLDFPSHSLLPKFTPHFGEILAAARSALQHTTTAAGVKDLLRAIAENCMEPDQEIMSPFAFTVGAIQPLYATATFCQDGALREEAIVLLERRPWREGAWDSSTMARIARAKTAGMGQQVNSQNNPDET